jgi:hypothetical protein
MMRPLLSLLIPTKDRAEYAVSSIATAIDLASRDVEVIVHDNSGDGRLEKALADVSDERLRYYHVREPMDVVANFSRATALARGEYVAAIGDDDAVTASLLEAVRWGACNDVDAIVSSRPAQYYWPDLRFRYYGAAAAGTLKVRPFTGSVTPINVRLEVEKCLASAGSRFYDIPRVYYGCVRRTCLEEVRTKSGFYYPGPSPDLSGAVAVSQWVRTAFRFDFPLFVPGSSRRSTAGLGAAKQHIGKLEAWPHLPDWCLREWSSIVPRFFSGPTIWGEDVVQALLRTGQGDMLRRFNVPLLYSLCLVFHPNQYAEILRQLPAAVRATGRSLALDVGAIPRHVSRVVRWRAEAVLRNMIEYAQLWGHRRYVGVENVQSAVKRLNEVCDSRSLKISFPKALPDAS